MKFYKNVFKINYNANCLRTYCQNFVLLKPILKSIVLIMLVDCFSFTKYVFVSISWKVFLWNLITEVFIALNMYSPVVMQWTIHNTKCELHQSSILRLTKLTKTDENKATPIYKFKELRDFHAVSWIKRDKYDHLVWTRWYGRVCCLLWKLYNC